MPAEEDKIRFSDLADELGLEGEEKDNYIGEHMMRKGYRAVRDWLDPEPQTGQAQGGQFFNGPQRTTPPRKATAPNVPPAKRAGGQYS